MYAHCLVHMCTEWPLCSYDTLGWWLTLFAQTGGKQPSPTFGACQAPGWQTIARKLRALDLQLDLYYHNYPSRHTTCWFSRIGRLRPQCFQCLEITCYQGMMGQLWMLCHLNIKADCEPLQMLSHGGATLWPHSISQWSLLPRQTYQTQPSVWSFCSRPLDPHWRCGRV